MTRRQKEMASDNIAKEREERMMRTRVVENVYMNTIDVYKEGRV